ncbi:MAG: Glu/Leu/Phe/Val dehydrogenase [Gemmatimonadota bacterium]|nr:MAG: Glu/Leu/Phe/Val dehydrogenase [Gemmatimonadota bacterium]
MSLDEHLFDLIAEHGHEQISFASDRRSGYRGVIAVHNTILGPALGGTRFWDYQTDAEAFIDVLRLSRGMTYKAAVAGLNLGGGKSVILGDYRTKEREGIMKAHGRHVESLQGRYITAEDVGTSTSDMDFVRQETTHVVGLAGRSGDPSPVTAFGTYRGMQACAKFRYGDESLEGKTVAVQGCGHVGYYLLKHLHEAGSKLVVSDIDEAKVKRCVDEFGATAVAPDEIYGVTAEIFAPCALGAIINDDTLKVLKVDIVAGAANNQLAEERHGDALDERDVLYAPDYVINGGGLINVNAEVEGWDLDKSHQKASEIYDTVFNVLEIARDEGMPTYRAADSLAERRIANAAKAKGKHLYM